MKRISRKSGPSLKPVEKVSLSHRHTKLRLALTIVFILIALSAFTVGVLEFVRTEPGWREIEASPSAQTVCTQELVFQYHLGASGVDATIENKKLSPAYTSAADEAYKLFSNEAFENFKNTAYINAHANETVTVEEPLYRALELLSAYGSRYLYLAPVYEQYRGLFSCTNDSEAAYFDPYASGEVRSFYEELAVFANDPEAVDIELLGDNRVKLKVSEAYLRYAEENGITSFIDFFWIKNAFVVDYIADALTAQGFTRGTITSFDGFSRTFDASDAEYAFNFYDRIGQTIYPAAVIKYTKPLSIVSLRSFPMSRLDTTFYYETENGEFRTPYIDLTDGLCKSADDSLTALSESRSCAEIALSVLELYTAESLDEEALASLDGIEAVYAMGAELRRTAEDIRLEDLYSDETVSYQLAD